MIKNQDNEYPKRDKFFGINADIEYLANWINTFISEKIDGSRKNILLAKVMEEPE